MKSYSRQIVYTFICILILLIAIPSLSFGETISKKIVGQYDYGKMSSSIGNYFIMNNHAGIKYTFTVNKWYEVDALVENDTIVKVLSVKELNIDKKMSRQIGKIRDYSLIILFNCQSFISKRIEY